VPSRRRRAEGPDGADYPVTIGVHAAGSARGYAVGLACRAQFAGALFELGGEVGLHLLESGQLALELIDLGRGAEPGGVPGLLAKQLG
jgi:hypothetical protein